MTAKTMFFFDTETTGLVPGRHAIIQIAWAIEKDGMVINRDAMNIKIADDDDICVKALEVNNRTLESLHIGVDAFTALEKMRNVIKTAVGGDGPLVPCGQNVKFDIDMLHAMAQKYRATWWLNFGSNDYLLLRKPVCTVSLANYLASQDALNLPDHKLGTLCRFFNIPLDDAHNAYADVEATRRVYHHLDTMIRELRL